MTTPSNFSETGIAIYATEPIISAAVMKYQMSLSQMVGEYSHEIAANGGYKSASISMTMRQDEIEDWLEYGFKYKPGDFPNAEKIGNSTITLPLYSLLKEKEVKYIINSVKEIIKKLDV